MHDDFCRSGDFRICQMVTHLQCNLLDISVYYKFTITDIDTVDWRLCPDSPTASGKPSALARAWPTAWAAHVASGLCALAMQIRRASGSGHEPTAQASQCAAHNCTALCGVLEAWHFKRSIDAEGREVSPISHPPFASNIAESEGAKAAHRVYQCWGGRFWSGSGPWAGPSGTPPARRAQDGRCHLREA